MIELHDENCRTCNIPFSHRVVTTPRGNVFRTCAWCDHWLNMPHITCRCKASCHVFARDNIVIDSWENYDPAVPVRRGPSDGQHRNPAPPRTSASTAPSHASPTRTRHGRGGVR